MAFQFFKPPNFSDSTLSPPTYTERWLAIGSDSGAFVRSYAQSATPGIVAFTTGTLYRQDVAITKTDHKRFEVTVPYSTRKNEAGDWTWDFTTIGGTVRITHAMEEYARYPSDTAPDRKGVIGHNGDEIAGVDKVIPTMKFVVQFRHPLGVMTIPRAKYLHSITGTVNADTFLTFAPGEVLFLGARGSDGSAAEASVTYEFAMWANQSGLSIGDIAGIEKKGHHYLWVRYKDAEVTADGKTFAAKTPQHVYVDRIYEEIDFVPALGFGA